MGRYGRQARVFALLGAAAVLGVASPAQAAGGRYSFDGGSAGEQATVRDALEASAFSWSVVPGEIRVVIRRGG